MKNSTKIGMAIIAAASILGAAYVYAFTGVVEEKAIMAGKVISVPGPGNSAKKRAGGFLPVSDPRPAVKEGDVLVTVTSLAGAVPASRAAADGVVKEVKVVKGQSLNKQDVVAVIEYR